MKQAVGQKRLFRIRPKFVAGCAAVIAALILPDAIARSHIAMRIVLLLAAAAILVGWFLLAKDWPKITWRALIALGAAVCLIVSLPVYVFEMSQVRWLIRHPWHYWLSMYVRAWVHWGYIFIFLSVICSFFGRGRARIAFVTGSVLLMVLRFAMGTWVF